MPIKAVFHQEGGVFFAYRLWMVVRWSFLLPPPTSHVLYALFDMPIIIKASGNDSTDAVIRKFQKKMVAEKVVQEYRDLMFHKKNSEKRKEMLAERRRKIRRAQRLADAG